MSEVVSAPNVSAVHLVRFQQTHHVTASAVWPVSALAVPIDANKLLTSGPRYDWLYGVGNNMKATSESIIRQHQSRLFTFVLHSF